MSFEKARWFRSSNGSMKMIELTPPREAAGRRGGPRSRGSPPPAGARRGPRVPPSAPTPRIPSPGSRDRSGPGRGTPRTPSIAHGSTRRPGGRRTCWPRRRSAGERPSGGRSAPTPSRPLRRRRPRCAAPGPSGPRTRRRRPPRGARRREARGARGQLWISRGGGGAERSGSSSLHGRAASSGTLPGRTRQGRTPHPGLPVISLASSADRTPRSLPAELKGKDTPLRGFRLPRNLYEPWRNPPTSGRLTRGDPERDWTSRSGL